MHRRFFTAIFAAQRTIKAKAEAAEHDTDDWKVGTLQNGKCGTAVCYFSPGGRVYGSIPKALLRMDEGPKLPTAGLDKPVCKGLNLGLSVHVERDLVIKVTVCVRLPTRLIVCRAGPVQGPRRVRGRRVRQEEAEQARAEGRARPASLNHRIASRRTRHAPRSSIPRPRQRPNDY